MAHLQKRVLSESQLNFLVYMINNNPKVKEDCRFIEACIKNPKKMNSLMESTGMINERAMNLMRLVSLTESERRTVNNVLTEKLDMASLKDKFGSMKASAGDYLRGKKDALKAKAADLYATGKAKAGDLYGKGKEKAAAAISDMLGDTPEARQRSIDKYKAKEKWIAYKDAIARLSEKPSAEWTPRDHRVFAKAQALLGDPSKNPFAFGRFMGLTKKKMGDVYDKGAQWLGDKYSAGKDYFKQGKYKDDLKGLYAGTKGKIGNAFNMAKGLFGKMKGKVSNLFGKKVADATVGTPTDEGINWVLPYKSFKRCFAEAINATSNVISPRNLYNLYVLETAKAIYC